MCTYMLCFCSSTVLYTAERQGYRRNDKPNVFDDSKLRTMVSCYVPCLKNLGGTSSDFHSKLCCIGKLEALVPVLGPCPSTEHATCQAGQATRTHDMLMEMAAPQETTRNVAALSHMAPWRYAAAAASGNVRQRAEYQSRWPAAEMTAQPELSESFKACTVSDCTSQAPSPCPCACLQVLMSTDQAATLTPLRCTALEPSFFYGPGAHGGSVTHL